MLFIITLVGVKWSFRHPRLSYDTIAARTGLSAEYCRKIAKTLDRRGLLKRSRKQGDANHFDLTEVFRQLSDFGPDFAGQRAATSTIEPPENLSA